MCRKKTKNSNIKNAFKESSVIMIILLKFWGLALYGLHYKNGRVIGKLSFVSLVFFVWWISFSVYFIYLAFSEEQTVVRAFYKTKLLHYGDVFEKITSTVFFFFAYVKISLHLSRAKAFFQQIVDIDKLFENMGVLIDYDYQARHNVWLVVAQTLAFILRASVTFCTLQMLGENIPWAKILQVSQCDTVALILSVKYYTFLNMITLRYKYLNQILIEIKDHNSVKINSITVISRNAVNPLNEYRAEILNTKMNDRIRQCSQIYGMLYNVVQKINIIFGLALALTLLVSLSSIILNIFYLLEATSAGLFHDLKRYANFLLYISWAIFYNASVIYVIVYSSEMTVSEAKKTSTIIYEIENFGMNQPVIIEVQMLSLQLLHQIPLFTAAGLINLDNALLLEAGRFMVTFMGLLLQFATSD